MHDYRNADLEPQVRALCDFAIKLTGSPSSVGLADADLLRKAVGIESEPDWGSE